MASPNTIHHCPSFWRFHPHDVSSAQTTQYPYFFEPHTSALYVNVEWFLSTLPNDETRHHFLRRATPYLRQTAICRHHTSYATVVFPHHVHDTKRYAEDKTKDPIRVSQRFYAFNTGRVISVQDLGAFATLPPPHHPRVSTGGEEHI